MVRRYRRSRKWISWLVILLLLIIAGIVCYLVWDNYFNDSKNDRQGKQEQVIDEERKEESEESNKNSTEKNDDEDDKKVVQYEGNDPNLSEELSGSVTYAGVLDGKITIRVNIDQYLSGGSCVLNLTRNGNVVYDESANVINSASTATCEGFDIPISNIGTGNYEIEIRISSGDKSGSIKGEVEI